jgi:hypothetical protein
MEITISGHTHRLKLNPAEAVYRSTDAPPSARWSVLDSYVDVSGTGWNPREESKKYRVHLRIDIDEIQDMMRALTEEVRVCHRFLREKNLLSELGEMKEKEAKEHDALERQS